MLHVHGSRLHMLAQAPHLQLTRKRSAPHFPLHPVVSTSGRRPRAISRASVEHRPLLVHPTTSGIKPWHIAFHLLSSVRSDAARCASRRSSRPRCWRLQDALAQRMVPRHNTRNLREKNQRAIVRLRVRLPNDRLTCDEETTHSLPGTSHSPWHCGASSRFHRLQERSALFHKSWCSMVQQ